MFLRLLSTTRSKFSTPTSRCYFLQQQTNVGQLLLLLELLTNVMAPWDIALDHGVKGTRVLQVIFSALCRSTSCFQCSICDAAVFPISSCLEHVCTDHPSEMGNLSNGHILLHIDSFVTCWLPQRQPNASSSNLWMLSKSITSTSHLRSCSVFISTPTHVKEANQLWHISEHCDFGDMLNAMLRDRLVCAINDQRIQRRLLAEPGLTFAKAMVQELAEAAEAAENNAPQLERATPTSVKRSLLHAQRRE